MLSFISRPLRLALNPYIGYRRYAMCLLVLSTLDVIAFPSPRAEAQAASPFTEESSELWRQLVSQPRWVFLGDSNTYSGGYVAILDAWLEKLDKRPELLNLGVSSETASGLSEVDHPFKRPCVHERIDKLLNMLQPNVVFACYGMNDGIYQPHSEENLAEYRDGMLKLAQKVQKSGAMLIVITPPMFEPGPVKKRGKLGPTDTGRYAYFAPAADYDSVLEKQAQWCLKNEYQALKVIDIREPLRSEKRLFRGEDPDFNYSGDGVHFGMVAHAIVAESILEGLGAPPAVIAAYPQDDAIQSARKKMLLLRDAHLSATGKNRPGLPAGQPVWLAERLATQIDREDDSP